MNNYRISGLFKFSQSAAVAIFTMFCTVYSWNAEATAPRVTPKLFGEVKVADIVSYQLSPLSSTSKVDGELSMELLTEAFKASGKSPVIDVLPSKQLATYALFNHDVAALIGSPRDIGAKQKAQYRLTPFLLTGVAPNDDAIALIVSTNVRGNELNQAFNDGLQKIIKNGKYLEILEKYRGKEQIPANYFNQLRNYKAN